MADDEPLDYCRLRKFGDTNGEQPIFALVCDNDFPISYRERSCLNACRTHWDYSKGYLTLYTENPDRQAKSTQENYIHGVVLDPATFLDNFGHGRIAKANRLEKESKALVNLWNKTYGPQAKGSQSVCMPKAIMFQLGKHSWPSRAGNSFSTEERSYMLLEVTTYAFAEAAKENRFQGSSGESATPKITLEDLEVYIKIASTKIRKAKPDKSNSAASSNHTTVFEGLGTNLKMSKDLLRATAFDRWGFRTKLTTFLKMLVSPFMAEVAEDCAKVLKCKGQENEPPEPSSGAGTGSQNQAAAKKGRGKKEASKTPAPKKRKSSEAPEAKQTEKPAAETPEALPPTPPPRKRARVQTRRPAKSDLRKKLSFTPSSPSPAKKSAAGPPGYEDEDPEDDYPQSQELPPLDSARAAGSRESESNHSEISESNLRPKPPPAQAKKRPKRKATAEEEEEEEAKKPPAKKSRRPKPEEKKTLEVVEVEEEEEEAEEEEEEEEDEADEEEIEELTGEAEEEEEEGGEEEEIPYADTSGEDTDKDDEGSEASYSDDPPMNLQEELIEDSDDCDCTPEMYAEEPASNGGKKTSAERPKRPASNAKKTAVKPASKVAKKKAPAKKAEKK